MKAPILLVAVAALAFASFGNPYADLVVNVAPGPAATPDPDDVLGPPSGGGLYSSGSGTYTLGVGGSLTLRLATDCVNGPGTDLIVSENPFFLLGTEEAFVEAMFVEVSSNGTDFARFPSSYIGPSGSFGPFTGSPPALYRGLAGAMPVSANPSAGIDPLDVVDAGGDAFDLDALLDHALVQAGKVDLGRIRYVSLVDVVAGQDQDSAGRTIWDHGLDAFASADPDAVTAVNNLANLGAGRPRVELNLDGAGVLTLRVEDDDGRADVLGGLKASVNGLAVPFGSLLPFFVLTDLTPTAFTLTTGPVPSGVFTVVLKVGTVDTSGLKAGDSIVIQ